MSPDRLSEPPEHAVALVTEPRFPFFPCHINKAPATPRGFKDAMAQARISCQCF